MQSTALLVAFVLLVPLTGCGGSKDDKADVRTPSGTEDRRDPEDNSRPPEGSGDDKDARPDPAAALTIRVFQEDSDAGVAAEINRLDDTGASFFVANVPDSGIAKLPQPCQAHDRFEAKPKVEAFLRVAPQPCASTVTFRLYGAHATTLMIRIAENEERAGNFAAAQSNYSKAADRLQFSKPAEADRLRVLAGRNVGKILGVEQPTRRVNGKDTIAPETVDKIKIYQRKEKIQVTGVIDSATREALLRDTTTVK